MTDGKHILFRCFASTDYFDRLNWSGTTLNNFYAAVRKALVVVIVLRAVGVLCGLLFAGWWIFA